MAPSQSDSSNFAQCVISFDIFQLFILQLKVWYKPIQNCSQVCEIMATESRMLKIMVDHL